MARELVDRWSIRKTRRPPPHFRSYPVLWTHSADKTRQMSTIPEAWVPAKSDKQSYVANSYWQRASRLVVAERIYTTKVRVAAMIASEPVLGSAWCPALPLDDIGEPLPAMKAWCAFLNSTMGTIFLLNIRTRKLTYPRYSVSQLEQLPLPDPRRCDITPLVRAFDDLCEQELQPWPQMDVDPVRHQIDAAVCEVLGLDPAEVADWRRRIVAEPTVSNKPAP